MTLRSRFPVGALKSRPGILIVLGLLITISAVRAADESNKLTRVRGDVSYAMTADLAKRSALVGSILLGGEASAITAFKAQAQLALPDSSLVQIGDRSTVRIGEFAKGRDGATEIVLERGAVRFAIQHPAGAKSNFVFRTPTTQLAVRGTIAYLISGPLGDQIYCVDCAPGDVTVRVGSLGDFGVASGQTLNVRRRAERPFDAQIVANPTINNPAIDQFLRGFSPFGVSAKDGTDPTGSGSGTGG